MKCGQAKMLFSPYLDGAVTGRQMHALSDHMSQCAGCQSQYFALQRTQQLLAGMGKRKPAPDLELRLRLALSREAAKSRRPYFSHMWMQMEHAVNSLVVPVAAGLAAAVVIFTLFMGFSALPLQANQGDVPLLLHTEPELQQSAFGMGVETISDDSLVIDAYVDARGRVQDYQILSNSKNSNRLLPQVKNMLIFTTFRPATSMGRPTAGHAVLSFSRISVKG